LFTSLLRSSLLKLRILVEAHLGVNPAKRLALSPATAKILFPSSKVLLEKKDVAFVLPVADKDSLKELQFVVASDDSLKESALANAAKKDLGTPISITGSSIRTRSI